MFANQVDVELLDQTPPAVRTFDLDKPAVYMSFGLLNAPDSYEHNVFVNNFFIMYHAVDIVPLSQIDLAPD